MKKVIMVLFAGLLAGCSNGQNGSITDSSHSASDIMTVSVGSELVDCIGVAPMKCLIVDGSLFYGHIKGFDFKNGYEYKLEIKRIQSYTVDNAPADAGLYEYNLLKVLSQVKVEY